ncbi:MAG: thioesterase family protein [Albidovulum sp.]|jgi:acyl-CoA thioester hydrolase|uniref:thioesterase family protein n=1 Tax=Albidovulum sp. TaxID=1872424 RepID=UPI003C995D39
MTLRLWQGTVLPRWLDYNGHMTEYRYLQIFGEISDALYGLIGVDFGNAADGAFYTLESHIRHLKECGPGTSLFTETEILAHDDKRLHLLHRLFDTQGTLLATGEHLSIHVRSGKVASADTDIQRRIAEIFAKMAGRPPPDATGSVLKRPLANGRKAG